VGDARQASRALQEAALARGRLLEMLAAGIDTSIPPDGGATAEAALSPSSPATLFTVGLMSMLEVLLQVPLPEALAPLHLSPPVQAALLQRTGPYAAYLSLAEALESSDPADIDRLEALATRFGGIDTVCAASAEAWAWAAGVAREAAGAGSGA
jgi:EAL and modified HD-GYP domain-containing signal transduction protein